MATYNFAYNFTAGRDTSYYSFNKNNQNITVRLSSQPDKSGRSTQFTVLLQKRVALVGYSTVGTASFPRTGMKEVTFKKLDSGSYRLRMEKSTDNVRIIGVGVMNN